MEEDIKYLNNNYFHEIKLTEYNNNVNNNDNFKNNFNVITSGSKNNYEKSIINYSNISLVITKYIIHLLTIKNFKMI